MTPMLPTYWDADDSPNNTQACNTLREDAGQMETHSDDGGGHSARPNHWSCNMGQEMAAVIST